MELKNSVYWSIFSDVWCYFKAHYPPRDDDSYWDDVVDKCDLTCQKYEGKPEYEFIKNLLVASISELERVCKDERKEGENEG